MKKENIELEQIVRRLMKEFEVIRKSQGLSHAKLANLTGLHRTTIGLLEKNKRIPTIATCLKIAMALEVDLDNLISVAIKKSK